MSAYQKFWDDPRVEKALGSPLAVGVYAVVFFVNAIILATYSATAASCTYASVGSYSIIEDTPACNSAVDATHWSSYLMAIFGALTVLGLVKSSEIRTWLHKQTNGLLPAPASATPSDTETASPAQPAADNAEVAAAQPPINAWLVQNKAKAGVMGGIVLLILIFALSAAWLLALLGCAALSVCVYAFWPAPSTSKEE